MHIDVKPRIVPNACPVGENALRTVRKAYAALFEQPEKTDISLQRRKMYARDTNAGAQQQRHRIEVAGARKIGFDLDAGWRTIEGRHLYDVARSPAACAELFHELQGHCDVAAVCAAARKAQRKRMPRSSGKKQAACILCAHVGIDGDVRLGDPV